MEFIKQCSTCDFNFSGKCGISGNMIPDITQSCSDWEESQDYYAVMYQNAPWYIRNPYDENPSVNLGELLKMDSKGEAITVNIFDAIKEFYGLTLVDLAVLFRENFGVMYYARNVRITDRRAYQFASTLRLPVELFKNTTTDDFDQIEFGKKLFLKNNDIEEIRNAMPDWKARLAKMLARLYLRCPMDTAKELSRMDRFYWSRGDNMDRLNATERLFVSTAEKRIRNESHPILLGVSYSLDNKTASHFNLRQSRSGRYD